MATHYVLDAYSWNIMKTLVSALSVTDPGQVIHRIIFSFDANEMEVWHKTTYFELYNFKGELIYTYAKAANIVGQSTRIARERYEEVKKQYPLAIVEFEESSFAEKYP